MVGAVRLAEKGGGEFDGWTGGSFEQTVRAHVDEETSRLIDHQRINFYEDGVGADTYHEYLVEFETAAHERALREGLMTREAPWTDPLAL